ncbi:MAG TPA: hypothetical protein VFB78_03040 [Acidimicrobiales bacterium]|nr:hypothetical protein [Acidimicrobiales bacterium]
MPRHHRVNGHQAPTDAHEWVSFDDPDEERTWIFDVTFLLSNWQCIFGNGCQGVLTGPAEEMVQGCCSYGAHFTDKKDVRRVEAAAATLTKTEWQFRKQGRERGVVKTNKEGDVVSRLVDGACIFLNRPGFAGGPGCALHRAALERNERPLDLKPDVCWQLPLRRDDETRDDGHVMSTIAQWDRHHWGAGGADFHWWCTEAREAFTGTKPVFRYMADELEEMVGPKVFAWLVAYLERRSTPAVPLPHPVARARL